MRTIDIITTQKVTITYELPSVWDRVIGYLIDITALVVSMLLMNLFFDTFDLLSSDNRKIVLLLFFVAYPLAMDVIFEGQSLGKMAMGFRVVKLDGSHATLSDYLIRWAFRLLDVYFSLGAIAIIMVSSSKSGQRLGGILSNTTVIRLNSKKTLQLKDILYMHSKKGYQPLVPEVVQLSEEDVLLIKKTIVRYNKYPNTAHTEVVRDLTKQLIKILAITKPPKMRDILFLNTLVKDYVILTR